MAFFGVFYWEHYMGTIVMHFWQKFRKLFVNQSVKHEKRRFYSGSSVEELDVEPLYARSPQAKCRVDRWFKTLQDRCRLRYRVSQQGGASGPATGAPDAPGGGLAEPRSPRSATLRGAIEAEPPLSPATTEKP